MENGHTPLKTDVLELMASSEVPVIALVAPAGFGKTALAMAYAERCCAPCLERPPTCC
jgi:predicted ribonuclease YlaK